MIFSEVERVVDLEPIEMGERSPIRFRVEIHKNANGYFSRLFRLEMCRIQPTFPQDNGRMLSEPVDELIWIDDETSPVGVVSGATADAVLNELCEKISRYFRRA